MMSKKIQAELVNYVGNTKIENYCQGRLPWLLYLSPFPCADTQNHWLQHHTTICCLIKGVVSRFVLPSPMNSGIPPDLSLQYHLHGYR